MGYCSLTNAFLQSLNYTAILWDITIESMVVEETWLPALKGYYKSDMAGVIRFVHARSSSLT